MNRNSENTITDGHRFFETHCMPHPLGHSYKNTLKTLLISLALKCISIFWFICFGSRTGVQNPYPCLDNSWEVRISPPSNEHIAEKAKFLGKYVPEYTFVGMPQKPTSYATFSFLNVFSRNV